jgi:3-deoxy-D-manno-octulosonate 8-phosphate phosphatase KdsC-like HAD superfamily phosphatase
MTKKDKSELLPYLTSKYNVNTDEIAYVGDDLPDLQIIKKLKYTYCPSDSIYEIKNSVNTVLTRAGGTGVIAELYDNIYNE